MNSTTPSRSGSRTRAARGPGGSAHGASTARTTAAASNSMTLGNSNASTVSREKTSGQRSKSTKRTARPTVPARAGTAGAAGRRRRVARAIGGSPRQPREDLVERLVGQRPHFLAGQRLDRMRHHHRPVLTAAERRRLRGGGPHELAGDHRRRGDAVVLEEHAVVHTARCARPSVGEPLHQDVGGTDDLGAQRVGRRAGEGGLLLAHDRPHARALAQQLFHAIEQVIPLGLRDVEQRDHLAVEACRPGGGLARDRDGVGGIEIVVGHRILLNTRFEPLENVQPGTTAEKRPAVPPATTSLMCSGARNFGTSVASCAGSANFRSTWSGSPSPPFTPGTSSRTGHCSRSKRKRRTSAFDQPSPAMVAACAGESTSSVSPQCVILWCSMTASVPASVAHRSAAVRLRWSYTVIGASAASSATVLSVGAKPCSTASDSHGFCASHSPMQYV